MLVVEASKKAEIVALKKVQCIHYFFYFQKNIANVKVSINLDRNVNTIISAFALKLDIKVFFTNVGA